MTSFIHSVLRLQGASLRGRLSGIRQSAENPEPDGSGKKLEDLWVHLDVFVFVLLLLDRAVDRKDDERECEGTERVPLDALHCLRESRFPKWARLKARVSYSLQSAVACEVHLLQLRTEG